MPSILPVKKAKNKQTKPQNKEKIREFSTYLLSDIVGLNLLTKSSIVTAEREFIAELNEDIAADMIAIIKIPITPLGRYFIINTRILRIIMESLTLGCTNPSITYMALTARAANHAVSELKKMNL